MLAGAGRAELARTGLMVLESNSLTAVCSKVVKGLASQNKPNVSHRKLVTFSQPCTRGAAATRSRSFAGPIEKL